MTDPDILAAKALLATVHHLMTGREIAICEDLVENAADWNYIEWELFDDSDRPNFTSLTIQFSREIATHLNQAA